MACADEHASAFSSPSFCYQQVAHMRPKDRAIGVSQRIGTRHWSKLCL